MALLAPKHRSAVEESIARLISRAENPRSLTAGNLYPRIEASIEKYLLKDNPKTNIQDIRQFIEALNIDDLCLIVACERGDESAWGDLVAKFDPAVKHAARSVTSNTEDADDLAGSIWAELYGLKQTEDGKAKGKLAYYSGRGSLAGWLRAVVSQLAIDQHRKIARFVQVEEDREFENLAQDSSTKDGNKNVLHSPENPEDMLATNESRKDVSAALRQAFTELEAQDRLMLKLYYFDNLKLKDIGVTLGFHEATASRKLVRVQGELRKSVENILTAKHGWKQEEVNGFLTETAARLDISVEKMFGLLMAASILQEIIMQNVL